MKNKLAIPAIALLGAALALGACAPAASAERHISVTSSAQVKVEPDMASFGVRIITQGATAEEAGDAHAAPVNAVIAALEAAGVASEDIQTTYTDLSPLWGEETSHEEAVEDAVFYGTGGNDIVGYQMTSYLQVSGVEVERVSELMDVCVGAGADGVDGPNYYVSSYDDAYAEALGQAIEAARNKAEGMADAAGVTLGQVISIEEGWHDTGLVYAEAAAADSAEGERLADMEIAPGQVKIEANVNVSFAIS